MGPGRKCKSGLKYWSFFVDLYDDEKLYELNEEYGPLGEAVCTRIMRYDLQNWVLFEIQQLGQFIRNCYEVIGCEVALKNKVKEIILFLPQMPVIRSVLVG